MIAASVVDLPDPVGPGHEHEAFLQVGEVRDRRRADSSFSSEMIVFGNDAEDRGRRRDPGRSSWRESARRRRCRRRSRDRSSRSYSSQPCGGAISCISARRLSSSRGGLAVDHPDRGPSSGSAARCPATRWRSEPSFSLQMAQQWIDLGQGVDLRDVSGARGRGQRTARRSCAGGDQLLFFRVVRARSRA